VCECVYVSVCMSVYVSVVGGVGMGRKGHTFTLHVGPPVAWKN
jgi:hypothetical protein